MEDDTTDPIFERVSIEAHSYYSKYECARKRHRFTDTEYKNLGEYKLCPICLMDDGMEVEKYEVHQKGR